MNQQPISLLFNELTTISSQFESSPLSGVFKLKNDFSADHLNDPSFYLGLLEDLQEIKRQTRILFIHSVLNKVCGEEGKLYLFDQPYQASMSYKGVMKKEGSFYLLDEDSEFREVFDSENFQQFIDDQYWELYE